MHEERIAVIDLGTNTFHLLIAQPRSGRFEEVYRERRFVRLAEDGIDRIGPAAYQRGLQALSAFCQKLEAYRVKKVKAFGTAALRTARNGEDFIREANERFCIPIALIAGAEEARLIYRGVSLAVPPIESPDLVMDIGGGSVEFIIAQRSKVFWAKSFPVGVAVLFNRFHRSDPISPHELERLNAFLDEALRPLQEALAQHPCRRLIGASGTFDVLENMAVKEKPHPLFARLPISDFPAVYRRVMATTLDERLQMKGIPPERADMIVVALELLRWVIDHARPEAIVISAYAMKEGIMREMVESGGSA